MAKAMNKNAERFAAYLKARKSAPPPLLFKYTSLAIARIIIETEMVRFSSPLTFNDPLDAQWNMLWQLSTPEFNRALVEKLLADDFDLTRVRGADRRREIQEERAKYQSLPHSEREQHIKAMAEDLDKDMVMPRRVSDQLRRLRMFCLGSVPDSVQMWSYYADGHQGVMLGFHIGLLEDACKIPVEKVTYADKLPEVLSREKYPTAYLDVYAYNEDEPEVDHARSAHLWSYTKARGWEHEQEWRFVFIADRGDTQLNAQVKFPIQALAGMVCGAKADKGEFDRLAGSLLAKNPAADIFLTAPHRGDFALVGIPINKSRWIK